MRHRSSGDPVIAIGAAVADASPADAGAFAISALPSTPGTEDERRRGSGERDGNSQTQSIPLCKSKIDYIPARPKSQSSQEYGILMNIDGAIPVNDLLLVTCLPRKKTHTLNNH